MKIKNGILILGLLPAIVFAQAKFQEPDSVKKQDVIGLFKTVFHKNAYTPTPRNYKKISYSFFPVSADVPGAGIALVTTTTAGFYLGDEKTSSLSTIVFSPFITFSGRVGFAFRSNL